MLKHLLNSIAVMILLYSGASAQVTLSSMSGFVKTSTGEGLAGASISAVHTPTGTVYNTQAKKDGGFDIPNMNPGGPYLVTVSFVNYETVKREDVFLALGESYRLNVNLAGNATQLTEVVVASRKSGALKAGTETVIGRDKMQTITSVGRNLSDYLRATPQLKITSGAYNDGGFSIAGQNNRFNSFYVDGSVNNDVFGLANTGTNGGQTGIAPLSIDAIDQFQVLVSPYDATLGNFTGGAVNAITKSGTNTVHGSAYYVFRNQDLSGKTPVGPKDAATKLGKFSNKTYGFTVGGPIIKNKLFYFVSAELQRDETPNPFDIGTYTGSIKTQAAVQQLLDTIRARGYDPGSGYANTVETKADRITAKFDWNINTGNKLTLSYRYTKGNKIAPYVSSPSQLEFYNAGYVFPTTTNSISAELTSRLGGGSSNRLLATFSNVVDDRDIIGAKAPSVQIFDGLSSGGIYFGPDGSSVYNYLSQKTFNILDHYKFNIGKNYFTAGFEAEYYKANNAFIQYVYGDYQYSTVADFFNQKPSQYRANFNLIDKNIDKNSGAAAKFDVAREAFFINDEIRINPNFSLTLGLRADLYQFITTPVADKFATDTAMPGFAQYYDLDGAFPGQKPSIPVAISPRLGINYKLPELGLIFRGGAGLFAGRIPLVWPGGIYNQTGAAVGGFTLTGAAANVLRYKTDGAYTPAQVGFALNDAKGNLNIVAEKFKLPKVLRTSVGIDKNWGAGLTTSIEAMYTKNINDILYYNINFLPPTSTMVGPDKRMVYNNPSTYYPNSVNTPSNLILLREQGKGKGNPYSGAYLLTNAKGDKGYSYNFTFTVNKSTKTGFNFYGAYNYGDSYVLNESASSTNNSQWGSQETVNGRNAVVRTRSDNSAGHRIFAVASKKFIYANKKMATTIALTYTGQSGQSFSYVYSGQLVRDGQSGYDLAYIPTETELQNMTFVTNSTIKTDPAEQKAAFNTYIKNHDYLNSRRGQYVERNGSRVPFSNVVDLRLAQDFNVKIGKSVYTFQVVYNMTNFSNFLNRNWGHQYFQGSDQVTLLTFSNYVNASTNLTPQYTFNPKLADPGTVTTSVIPTYSSRWLSQLEFRINF